MVPPVYPHFRRAVRTSVGVVCVLVLGACSSNIAARKAAERTTTSGPAPTASTLPGGAEEIPIDPGGATTTPGETEVTTDDSSTITLDTTPSTSDGPGDAQPTDAEACLSVGTAYLTLIVTAFGGEDLQGEVDRVMAELRDTLPEDLQDDIDVVADTWSRLGDGGILSNPEVLDEPAYVEADANIQAWIEANCN